MKNNRLAFLLIGFLALSFSISSCDENLPEITEDKLTSPTDYTSILEILDLNDVSEVIEDSNLKSATATDYEHCFEVVIHDNGTTEFWPRSWTFVYGDEQCTDYFGNIKLGSVHVVLTDFWKNEGSSRTVTFEDYSINGNKLEGIRTIVNTGVNENQNLTFERSFENASFTKGDTASMTWDCARDVEMLSGFDTFVAADDEYLVSGGADGINYDGKPFELKIVDPLYYKACVRFPVSGSVTIEVEDTPTITINYGEGECDNLAEMTVDGVSTEITLDTL